MREIISDYFFKKKPRQCIHFSNIFLFCHETVLDFLGGLSDLDFDLDRSLEELLLLRRGMSGKLGVLKVCCCFASSLRFCQISCKK